MISKKRLQEICGCEWCRTGAPAPGCIVASLTIAATESAEAMREAAAQEAFYQLDEGELGRFVADAIRKLPVGVE